MSAQQRAKAFIESEIASHQVVVFSKTYCGFCSATKGLLNKKRIPELSDVQVHELDTRKDGALIQRTLLQMTGQRTVPSVFVNGQHIGGNSDTEAAYYSGVLRQKLLVAN